MVTHPLDGAEGGGEAAKEKKKEKKKKPKDVSDADESGRCVPAAAVGMQQLLQLHARDAASFCVAIVTLEAPPYHARPRLANHKTQHVLRHFFTFSTSESGDDDKPVEKTKKKKNKDADR